MMCCKINRAMSRMCLLAGITLPVFSAQGLSLADLDYLMAGKAIDEAATVPVLRRLELEERSSAERITRLRRAYKEARLPRNVSKDSVLDKVSLLDASRARMKQEYLLIHEYLVLQKALFKNQSQKLQEPDLPALAQLMNRAVDAEVERILTEIGFGAIRTRLVQSRTGLKDQLETTGQTCDRFRNGVDETIARHIQSVSNVLSLEGASAASSTGRQ